MYILTLNLLTTAIFAPPSNASKWQMGFNSAFKGLIRNDRLQNKYTNYKGIKSNTNFGQITGIQEKLGKTCK